MKAGLRSRCSGCRNWILSVASAVVVIVVGCPGAASAQVTQVYSFEPGLEGFAVNGGQLTVSLNTDGNFASEGTNSMKFEFTPFGSFAGGLTEEIHPAFFDAAGIDFVRFDLINTNRFVPEEPGPSDPTFADTSITVFGDLAGEAATIQFLGSQEPIGDLEPGTHEVTIDVTAGGLWVDGGETKGFNEWVAEGFMLTGFQIYINKNFGVTPNFAWTVYIDNIRVGVNSAAIAGDYSGNGIVDAADYTVWRDRLGDTTALTNTDPSDVDGVVTQAEYLFWKSQFGQPMGSGNGGVLATSAVPEPGSAVLWIAAGLCWWSICRGRLMPRQSANL